MGGPQEQGGGDAGERSKLRVFSDTVNNWLGVKFYNLGVMVATHPWKNMWAAIVAFLIFAAIASQTFEQESRGDKLWIPQNTQAVDDAAYADARFPRNSLVNNAMIRKSDGSNVLTHATLSKLMDYQDAILGVSVACDADVPCRPSFDANGDVVVTTGSGSGNCDFRNLCSATTYTDASSGAVATGCLFSSVLDFFADADGNYSRAILDNNTDVLSYINARLAAGATRYDGSPLSVGNSLGGATYDSSGQLTGATVVQLAHLLDRNPTLDETTNEEMDVNVDAFFAAVVTASEALDMTGHKLDFFNDHFFGQEFRKAIQSDVFSLNIGIILLIIFSACTLGRFSMVECRGGLAFCGVLSSGFALASTFGFSSLCGMPWTPLHSSLAFILLGIGVDDMFVIVFQFDKTDPTLDLPERMGLALKTAGTSVLVTSFTDFVAFMIGATTLLPALSSFCFWAGVGIMFDFCFFVTFFVGCLVLDTKRRSESSCCCCCCCGDTGKVSNPPGNCCGPNSAEEGCGGSLRVWFETTFFPALMTKPAQVGVTSVVVGLLVMGSVGVSNIKMDFDLKWFLPDDSPAVEYIEVNRDYFDVGQQVTYVIMENTDYVATSAAVASLSTAIAANPHVNQAMSPVVTSWHDGLTAESGGTLPSTSAGLYSELTTYLNTNGSRYIPDFGRHGLVRDSSNAVSGISYSRLIAWVKSYSDAKDLMDMMNSMRKIGTDSSLSITTHSEDFIFIEQFKVIEEELYRNLLLATVCIFIVVSVLIAHPGAALIVTLTVVITLVDVLGTAHFLGLTINSVTAIYMILAIGLTVDYSAHVAHHFMMHQGTRAERAIAAVSGVGLSVFLGGTSTVVAVLVLSFSKTYIFQVFFYMFFFTCFYGLFHGLIFLPIVLANIGPDAFTDAIPVHAEKAKAVPDAQL